MRQICTHIVRLLSALIGILMLSSCMDDLNFVSPSHEKVTVGFYAGGAQTRTTMLENGLSAQWEDGDQLAVWAVNSSGAYTLSNQVFRLYGSDYGRGFFTSDLDSPMPEDTYTYYASYPAPKSVDRTTVTFNVPAIQDGKASGGVDIMIATPVSHGKLTAVPEPEDHSGMRMQMNHMLHQFRFYVPQDDTKLGDSEIERILLDFPKPIVGNVVVDYTDPSYTATLSTTGSTGQITLNLSDPISVSDEVNSNYDYACLAFAPTFFESGQIMNLKAYTADQIVYFNPIELTTRNFGAGHSTPVKLNISEITDYPYQMIFTLSINNLGENPNTIIFTAPEGCVWAGGNSNVFEYTPGHEILVNEKIAFRYENESQYRAFSGKTIEVTYDSDNAITRQTINIPDLTTLDKSNFALNVPYLFFEDFSGIPDFTDEHDNPTVIGSISLSDIGKLGDIIANVSDTYAGIYDLSGNALAGWYGARIGGQSGKSIRICCRYEHVILAGAYYKGRVYTPFLSNIKDDKDVKISVSFKYACDRNELSLSVFGMDVVSPADKSPVLYFGLSNQETITNPDAVEGDVLDQVTGLYGGSGYANPKEVSLSPKVIDGEALPKTGGSYTSVNNSRTITISNVDNGMRLAWVLSTDNDKSNTHSNYWLYLDDIKVSIVK